MNRIQWSGLIFLGTMIVAFPANAQTNPRETCTQENRNSLKAITDRMDADYSSPSAPAFYKAPPYVASKLFGLASMFLGADLPACALQYTDEAIRLYPDSYMLYQTRGTVHQVLEKFDLALRDYDMALALAARDVGKADALSGVGTTSDQRIAAVLGSRAALYIHTTKYLKFVITPFRK
jgi:tetratricopeptide (TPR) repeat protein